VSRTAIVDAMYEAFVGSLPFELREPARGLACALGLASSAEVPWSAVYRDAFTLGAPLLVADADPSLGGAVIHDAVTAHLLATIDASASARNGNENGNGGTRIDEVIEHARRGRDSAIARVSADEATAYDDAGDEAERGLGEERSILVSGCGIDRARYLAVARLKQRHRAVACLALARAAGWDPRRREVLARLLDSAWTALQLHDDAVEWERDFARGGSWVVALAGGSTRLPRDEDGASVRGAVLASGVVARLLGDAARGFAAARRRARALGALRLAAWAREREATVRELGRRERESPGFAGRSRALSAWARSS
jgi:hypothetical protein